MNETTIKIIIKIVVAILKILGWYADVEDTSAERIMFIARKERRQKKRPGTEA